MKSIKALKINNCIFLNIFNFLAINLDHRDGNISKDDTDTIKRELKEMLAKPNESIQLVKNPEEKYDIIAFENTIIGQLFVYDF
jgi:hypothetical protein